MGRMTINFADVEGSFEAIPPGKYEAVVEKVEVRESKSSDHPYLNWEWTITEGEHEGRKMWQITSLSPKAFFRLKDQFIALGCIEGDEEDFPIEWDDDVEVTPGAGPLLLEPDVAGLAATLIVTVEPYGGVDRNKVDNIQAAGNSDQGGAPKSSSKSSGSTATRTSSSRRALR